MTRKYLKQIIQEVYQEIVNENQATDPQTQSLINEFGQLTQELNREKLRLKEMELRHTAMETQIRTMLESLELVEDKTLATEKFIAEIIRKGYSRDNIKYKEAFTLALTKVNEATRRVLEEAVEATKGVTKVASSIGIKSLGEDMNEYDGGIEKAMMDIDLANKSLSKLAMVSVEESGGSVPNHPSPFEPTNESNERPYVCVHSKKGKVEVTATSSYQAAQKAAQKWGLKSTDGIDAYLADITHTPTNEAVKVKNNKPSVKPVKKGMFDDKSKLEIEKMKAVLEKQNDVLKKAGKPIPHQNRVKMAQYNLALKNKTKSVK